MEADFTSIDNEPVERAMPEVVEPQIPILYRSSAKKEVSGDDDQLLACEEITNQTKNEDECGLFASL